MNKIILSTFVVFALSSCKKENPKTEDLNAAADSVSVAEPVSTPAALKIVTPQQTSEFLGKKNDTLYVTNFFATWCGPCVKEIPHFKNKIQELNGKPVKITFVSLDNKDVWNTDVPKFTDEQEIRNNTVILDGDLLDGKFFSTHFKEWTGSAIPFTFMRKGDKTDETLGMISEEQLNEKINSLLK